MKYEKITLSLTQNNYSYEVTITSLRVWKELFVTSITVAPEKEKQCPMIIPKV